MESLSFLKTFHSLRYWASNKIDEAISILKSEPVDPKDIQLIATWSQLTQQDDLLNHAKENFIRFLDMDKSIPLDELPNKIFSAALQQVDEPFILFSLLLKDIQDLDLKIESIPVLYISYFKNKYSVFSELIKHGADIDFSITETNSTLTKFSDLEINYQAKTILDAAKNDREQIINALLKCTNAEEIKSLFQNANYSNINGIYRNGRSFLAEIVIRKAPSVLMNAMIEAGANPYTKHNGQDTFTELSLSDSKENKSHFFSRFFTKPLTNSQLLKNAWMNANKAEMKPATLNPIDIKPRK